MRANWWLFFLQKAYLCMNRSHRIGCISVVDATQLLLRLLKLLLLLWHENLLLRHLLLNGSAGRCHRVHLALHQFLVLHSGSLRLLGLLLLLDAVAVNHSLKRLQLLLLGLVLRVGLQLDGLLVLLGYHKVVHAEAVRGVA